MNIRQRLLQLLLPPLIAFVTLISLFFYFNWQKEITTSFESYLKSAILTLSQTMSTQDISWLKEHSDQADVLHSPLYKKYYQTLAHIKENFPFIDVQILDFEQTKSQGYESNVLVSSTGDRTQFFELSNKQIHDLISSHHLFFSETKNDTSAKKFLEILAPIENNQNDTVAFVAAKVNLDVLDRKTHYALLIIVFSSILTILLTILSVFFIADKISKPVRQLNNAALDLAAGHYEEDIVIEGPQEIKELANTLSTVGECMQENLNRLKEASVVRERLYGEYECALLLQSYMLDNALDAFNHSPYQVHHFKVTSKSMFKGLLLDSPEQEPNVQLDFYEAKEKGFDGIYHLLDASKRQANKLQLHFNLKNKKLSLVNQGLPQPYYWSFREKKLTVLENERLYDLQKQDLIFFFNHDFAECFIMASNLSDWFKRLTYHFAPEGFPLLGAILTNELQLLSRKQQQDRNIHLFCIQI